jgi:hydroxymethylpyrimidine pyrophosphatase-like HAD family hydrolase
MTKLSTLRKKADKLLQQWGRNTYKFCLACGKQMSCLHHYYPKSTSSALRYDYNNLIPICNGCHFRHHNGDPSIHNTINEKKGDQWLAELKKKKENIIKISVKYYEEIINKFK